jgi:membrane fusion protein (multidrug efflux system)
MRIASIYLGSTLRVRRFAYAVTVGAGILALAACGKKNTIPAAPLPEVSVVTVQHQAVTISSELPGRVDAYLAAEVRARVDGIVLSRDFVEGADVKAGQRLYQIDPAPYAAAYHSAQAALEKAQASLVTVSAQAARYKTLVEANAVSRQDYDNAVAALGQARADVDAGKAAVDLARINLGYTSVLAPIAGRIGKSQVTPGAYVQASAATLMSTIQKIDPVYVDLTQSSLDGLRLRQALTKTQGDLAMSRLDRAKVSLTLEDGTSYPLSGTLQFSDITVDPGTGSVTVRAMFPNPRHVLLPGMFVRASLTEGVNESAILVPQVSLAHDQKGDATVWVVGPDDKASLRVVTTAQTLGNQWVVNDGLQAGERVIVAGLQRVRPGMAVKVLPAPSAGIAGQAAGATEAATGAVHATGAATDAAKSTASMPITQ